MARIRDFRMSVEQGAPDEAVMEAAYRMNYDGIPRHVYADGKIMKWDWELSEGALTLEQVEAMPTFEEHVARLIAEAEVEDGKQGR
jgi:catechol-2,3-dioxygenase